MSAEPVARKHGQRITQRARTDSSSFLVTHSGLHLFTFRPVIAP